MSAPTSNATPPIAASQNATAATASSSGSSANVAAGSVQPTARSYASATKKASSPPIASSAAPPVAVGGSQNPQHGKNPSVSPVNGQKPPIQPAVPAMGPTIVSGGTNGASHDRKPSVTISAAGPGGQIPNGGTSRAPSGLTFGAMSGSPAPSHAVPQANLNPQQQNPRIASPAHSPSPIPAAQFSGGRPNQMSGGRPEISFGGESGEQNARPLSMPPQSQHLRRESSQSAHSDMSNPAFNSNRGFPPNGGRGRGYPPSGYNPQMANHSPQPFRAMPNQPRGGMPQFQPQQHPNSPYRQASQLNRSPAMTPANPAFANGPGGYYQPGFQPVRISSHTSLSTFPVSEPGKPFTAAGSFQSSQYVQQNGHSSTAVLKQPEFRLPNVESNSFLRSISPSQSSSLSTVGKDFEQYLTELQHQNAYGMPAQGADPYYGQYYGQPGYGMQQSIHNPFVPASPGRGYPQPMQGHYGMPQPFVPPQGAQSMSRTPSNMSERPPSAVPQPSTPAMTNVNHVSHTPTPSVGTGTSPGPSSNFVVPPKKKSSAIVIKNADGEVVNFDKKIASPAPPVVSHPKSPAIVSTPTPPPRAPSAAGSSHSRTESVTAAKTAEEKRLEFVNSFKQKLSLDKEKEDADKKATEEQEAKTKAEAEAKALKEKEEAEAKAAKEKEEAEKAAKEAKEKEEAEAAEKAKKEAEEEEERLIKEMEEMERLEEERERAYQEKKKAEQEAKKASEAEDLKKEEERLRKLEREAEEREEARAKGEGQDAESAALFASLKKNTQFGPGAAMQTDSGASTPEPAAITPTQPTKPSAPKQKPAPLHLQTNKAVEPPPMTAGMQSLKSARFLQVRDEAINYPDGFKSPNPALNMGSKKGRQYDKDFLLQFQEVFKEKPSVDWDMKLKETVGDSSDSAAPKSARPSSGVMGGRQGSRSSMAAAGPAMGSFASFGGRTLPPGTTSEQRFQQATGQRGPTMTNPLAFVGQRGPGGSFPMAPPMARSGSYQNVSNMGPGSPRVGSSRGRGSRRGPSKKEEEKQNSAMPLTANLTADKLILEKSNSGWKPLSLSQASASGVPPSGHMPPDMVQRKVKAALNKMTPEKFDKIADQILEIAAQSKDETDGRTLRQVIQLTFEKACDEAHWASMYAKFAQRMLQTMSNDIKDDNVLDKHGAPVVGGALFRKYLLNRCQEEFERGWEVNLPEKPEGATEEAAMLSDEYYVAAAAKRKGLGLIQFIGELYKLRMLTLRIMHECVLKLLDFEGLPDEGAIESLVKLIRTVGSTMEKEEAGPKMLSVYFERIEKIMNMDGLPSRLKFMLLDIIDLRKKNWDSKDSNKGPKTIAEIRQEAAAAQQAAEMERARTSQRGGPRPAIGRGDARSFSGGGMMPPQDYPSGRVQMDDLRKLSKGASGRNHNTGAQLGPSMLGSRSSSGRRGLGPGGLIGRGDESGASSRTATPPQKEKESATHMNSFSALAALENEGAGEVGSPPSTASSPPVQKAAPAVEPKEVAPSA